MAILEIPVHSEFPSYTFTLDLEGVSYSFRFRYNTRSDRWSMSVGDANQIWIVTDIPLLTATDLLARFSQPTLPPGTFIVFDSEDRTVIDNPTADDLGSRFLLLYDEALSG